MASSGNDPLKSPVKLASRVPEPALCKRFVSHIPWLRNFCRLSARLRSGHWRDREKKYLVRLIQLRFSELWPTYASLSNRLNYQTGKASSERRKKPPRYHPKFVRFWKLGGVLGFFFKLGSVFSQWDLIWENCAFKNFAMRKFSHDLWAYSCACNASNIYHIFKAYPPPCLLFSSVVSGLFLFR